MYYIKVKGMGKLIFADTFEDYVEGDSTIKHIEGFIIDQRSGVYGNFGVNDVKEVTFTVSADGTTAEFTVTQDEYNHVPEVGEYIWVRLKDDDGTIVKLQVADVVYDEFVYTNTDATSYIQNKHNTVTVVAQDWDTDDYINAESIVTIGGLTETADNTDWEVLNIGLSGADTVVTLKQVADEDAVITPQDPLTTDFTMSVDIDVDEEAIPAASSIHAKENVITLLADTRYTDDGLIVAGDIITITGSPANDTTGMTSSGDHLVESISDDGTDTTIRIHNTSGTDMVTDTFADDGSVTITTAEHDIETLAAGVTIYADRNALEINYTGAVPEILQYLEDGDSIILTTTSTTNDGTYTISSIDTTQENFIILNLVEPLTSDSTDNVAGDEIKTTDSVVFTNANSSSNVIEKVSTLTWKGADLTNMLTVGDSFTLANTDSSNGTYVVRTIDYNITTADATTITVDNSRQIAALDEFDGTDEVIGSTYKKYNFTASDVIVRAKSTLVIHDNTLDTNHAVTGEKYANITDMNDLVIRRDGESDIDITIESISDDGTDTTILVEEHIATIADLEGASIIAPDRDITFTNSVATSEIISGETQRIVIQCASTAELNVLATYFDYPIELAVTMANGSTTLGGGTDTNNGVHTIEAVDINVPDLKFTMYITDATTLFDETLSGTDETFTVNNDFIWVAGADSALTQVDAYLQITGATPETDGYIVAEDTLTIAGTEYNDGDYEVGVITESGGITTITFIEDPKVLVDETLSGDEYIQISDTVTVTNGDATSNFAVTSFATIEWYGEDLTSYLAVTETITLANMGESVNDVNTIIMNEGGSGISWDGTKTVIWVSDNLTAEASIPLDATITNSGNEIKCIVGTADVTSLVSHLDTEEIVWNSGGDLTAEKPYYAVGDIIDIYMSDGLGGYTLLLENQEIATVDYDDNPLFNITLVGSDITTNYPYGITDNLKIVSKSKTVDYIVGADAAGAGAVAVDVDRIVLDGEWMPGEGVFTSDGYITIDSGGTNEGTWTIDSWNYDVDVAGKTNIILDASVHAWELTEQTDPNGDGDTISYEGTYTYTESTGTDSAITSDIDRIYLANQAYTIDTLKEFLEGDTFYMDNLDENSAINGSEFPFTISAITSENADADTQIVIEETWQFVYETLDSTTEEFHTDDELDADITIANTGGVLGEALATTDSFILTVDDDLYEPNIVKITNVDFNTPVYNIDTIWDDEPEA